MNSKRAASLRAGESAAHDIRVISLMRSLSTGIRAHSAEFAHHGMGEGVGVSMGSVLVDRKQLSSNSEAGGKREVADAGRVVPGFERRDGRGAWPGISC